MTTEVLDMPDVTELAEEARFLPATRARRPCSWLGNRALAAAATDEQAPPWRWAPLRVRRRGSPLRVLRLPPQRKPT